MTNKKTLAEQSRAHLALNDLLEELGVVLVVEGRVAAQQDVADHTDAPHVHLLSVRFLLEHLRSYEYEYTKIIGSDISNIVLLQH